MKKQMIIVALAMLVMVMVAVPGYAAKKSPTITMVVLSETESEIEVSLAPPKGEEKDAIRKTLVTKQGVNYIRSPRLSAGKWKATVLSYGDTVTHSVDVGSGNYTVFFTVSPPRDGDSEQKANVIQL